MSNPKVGSNSFSIIHRTFDSQRPSEAQSAKATRLPAPGPDAFERASANDPGMPPFEPPVGAYTSLERAGQALLQSLATLSGAVPREDSKSLERQIAVLLAKAAQAVPLRLGAGRAGGQSLSAEAALHMLNSVLGELASQLCQGSSRASRKDQTTLGADPVMTALNLKAAASLLAAIQDLGGNRRTAAADTRTLPTALAMVMPRLARVLAACQGRGLTAQALQVFAVLERLRHGDLGSEFPTAGLIPGHIPVVARQVPPGMKPEEAEARSRALNEAITKGDVGKIREMSKDDKSMAMATPEEKATMARILARRVASAGDDEAAKAKACAFPPGGPMNTCIPAFLALVGGGLGRDASCSERDANREAINNLLKSTGSPEQYRQVLLRAGPGVIQEAMQAGVQDPGKDRYLADFNIISGAMGASEFATDPAQAALGENARAKGYSTQEVLDARARVSCGGNDDHAKAMSENPLAMLLATSHEKAAMIGQLKDGYTSDSEDRAIVSILESCQDKAEFDAVLNESGGRNTGEELDDGEAKRKYDLLCGAYGRCDAALDAGVAHWAAGALTDSARTQQFLGGANEGLVKPKPVDASQAVPAADRGDPLMARSGLIIAHQQASIAARVDSLDRRALVDAVITNAEREHDGKPLVNPLDLRRKTNAIMADGSLDDGQRKEKIDQMRKDAGLSEYCMRNICTQPLSQLYDRAALETGCVYQAIRNPLEEQLQQTEATYGKDSPQAQAVKAKMAALDGKLGSYAKRLGGASNALGGMYPPPTTFWEDFSAFVSHNMVDMLAPLLNVIPGVGTAMYTGYLGFKAMKNVAEGNLSLDSFIALASSAVVPIGGAVGGALGDAANVAGQVLSVGNQAYHGVDAALHGDVLGAVSGFGGALLAGADMAGADAETLDTMEDGLGMVTDGCRVGVGMAEGKWDMALGGLSDLAASASSLFENDDSAGARITNLLEQGARFGSNLVSGDYLGALEQLGGAFDDPGIEEWVSSAMENPALRDIVDMTKAGAGVVSSIMAGDYSQALQGLSDELGNLGLDVKNLLDEPIVQNVLTYGREGAAFFQNLRGGKYGQALDLLAQNVGPLLSGSEIQQTLATVERMGGALEAGLKGDFLTLQRRMGQAFEGSQSPLELLKDGVFSRSLGGLAKGARQMLADPAIQQGIELLSRGSEFSQALVRGDISEALSRLGEMPGLEALRPTIDRARAALAETAPFITDLASGRSLRGLSALAGGGSPLAIRMPVRQALPRVRDATAFFASLTSGFAGAGLGTALAGLQELSARMRSVEQLERRAHRLVRAPRASGSSRRMNRSDEDRVAPRLESRSRR